MEWVVDGEMKTEMASPELKLSLKEHLQMRLKNKRY